MSKLFKFRDLLWADEAAVLLGDLIGEDVTEDDIYDLIHYGHLPLFFYAEEGFVGIPIIPPLMGGNEKEVWTTHIGEYDPPLAIYAETLVFPAGWLETDIGTAPVNAYQGVFYAWFRKSTEDGITIEKHGKLKPINPKDTWDHSLFRPHDIMRIASEANSIDKPAPPPTPRTEGLGWAYDDEGKRITIQLLPSELREGLKDMKKQNNNHGGSTNFLAIAALMELLKAPVEHPRPWR